MKKIHLVYVLLFLVTNHGTSQTVITSSMDWSTGIFSVMATRPLNPGMTPKDHPQALQFLEQEIPSLIQNSVGSLAWNSNGTLADFIANRLEFRPGLEKIVQSMDRLWSRLSTDRKSVEAEYSVNLATIAGDIFPIEAPVNKHVPTIGWVPVPDDPWTGIIIYAPANIPVRGKGTTASPQQALRSRILDTGLNPLNDPEMPSFAWFPLERRHEAADLVGLRPYRVIVRELYGVIPCDLILGMEDTRRIMASESGKNALKEGRVAILHEKTKENK